MRQVIKSIHPYSNFNESRYVEVQKLFLQGSSVAAVTRYWHAHNCSHFLEESTITLVLEGEKYMLVNGIEYFLKPGDLLYIPRNTLVFTDIPKAKTNFRSLNVVLSNQVVHLLFGEHALNTKVIKASVLPALIRDAKKTISSPHFGEIQYRQILRKLLDPVRKEIFLKGRTTIKTSTEKIINHVLLQSIHHPLNLPQMATLSNMSLATFKRHFKAIYGVAPKMWLRDQRLQAAYFHLKTNKEKVSDVLTQLGFDNFSHFSYLFRKTFHMTPSSIVPLN